MKGKEKIEEAATRLFAEKGYHGTSISMIAKEAEVAQGLLYMYFKNKEALLETLVNSGLATVMDDLFHAVPHMDATIQFRNFMDHYHHLVHKHAQIFQLVYGLLFYEESRNLIKKRYAYYERAQKERIMNIFMQRNKDSAVQDTDALWFTLEGWTMKTVMHLNASDNQDTWLRIRYVFS